MFRIYVERPKTYQNSISVRSLRQFTHLVRASASALVVVESDASQDERDEEDDVGGQHVHVPEGQPTFEDPLAACWYLILIT